MKHHVKIYIALSTGNKEKIEKSEKCGCYSCGTIFNSIEIKEFIDESNGTSTAYCPKCMIDSIIDEVSIKELDETLTPQLLEDIQKKAF